RTPFSKLHDLHAASTEVEHHSVIDRQRTNSTDTPVIGLFIRVDHLNVQAKFVSRPGDEIFSVLSVTHGGCGESKDTPGSVGANDRAKLSESTQCRRNRFVTQATMTVHVAYQTQPIPGASQNPQLTCSFVNINDKTGRIRTDVDDCNR